MVRLRVLMRLHITHQRFYFNSYMVRLRGAWAQRGGLKQQFQFLHGAIKGYVHFSVIPIFCGFQFLHGAIKGGLQKYRLTLLPNFNSYMVRLRDGAGHGHCTNQSNFNSYMVRLRAQMTTLLRL